MTSQKMLQLSNHMEDPGDDPPKSFDASRASEYHIIAGKGFQPNPPPSKLPGPMPAGVYEIKGFGQLGPAFVRKDLASDKTIRIPDGAAATVIAEIDKFWGLGEKFKQYGFMHKRGFLLYGPPGTGKTTTIGHIMQDMVARNGLVILAPYGDPSTLIVMLESLREVEPTRKLLVIMEDLDNLIRHGEVALLSLLDGEHAIDGVVYIATTNYIERLPARIANRPSRFDRKILIPGPTAAARRLFLQARGVAESELDAWVAASHGLSMAHLKELIITVAILGNDLAEEAKRLQNGGKDLMVSVDD